MDPVLVTAIGGLAGAIVFLFGILKTSAEKTRQERDECLLDRLNLWKEIYRLSQHNCPVSDCPMRAAPAPLSEVTRVAGKRIEELQSRLKVNPA